MARELVGYWPGHDEIEGQTGNTVLFAFTQVDAKFRYLYVGPWTFTFSTEEPILEFRSLLGNNDVPYPYAHSQNYWFMFGMGECNNQMIPKRNVPKKFRDPTKDPNFDATALLDVLKDDQCIRFGDPKKIVKAIQVTKKNLLQDFCLVLPRGDFAANEWIDSDGLNTSVMQCAESRVASQLVRGKSPRSGQPCLVRNAKLTQLVHEEQDADEENADPDMQRYRKQEDQRERERCLAEE